MGASSSMQTWTRSVPRAANRLVQDPRGQSDHRVHPKVQLAAEPTAAGGRDHPNGVLRQPHNIGDLVPVHIRRLGGDSYLKSVSYATGPALLRVRYSHVRRTPSDSNPRSRHRQFSSRPQRRPFDKSFCHDVAGMIIVNTMGVFGQRRVEDRIFHPAFHSELARLRREYRRRCHSRRSARPRSRL